MKTRDAFALKNFDVATLFDFKKFYEGDAGLAELAEKKALAFHTAEILTFKGIRVVKQIMRLMRYQATLAAEIAKTDNDAELKRRVRRAGELADKYRDISHEISALHNSLSNVIKDVDLVARRETLKKFSARLKESRKAAGLTQKQLAAVLGMSQNSYVSYELGRREPSYFTLITLSRLLNKSVDWLLNI